MKRGHKKGVICSLKLLKKTKTTECYHFNYAILLALLSVH
jgi:hypothetical protein